MMRQILERWSNLAPTECHRRETSVFDSDVYTVNGTNFFVNDTDIICFMPGEAEMWIERALRQAIVARGWDWTLLQFSKGCQGYVYPGVAPVSSEFLDEPAAALLAAYVGALETTG